MHTDTTDKLPVSVRVGYGAASGAIGMMYALVSLFILFFLTDVVKLDPAYAGFIVMVGTLWDAFLNPLIGTWSDRSRSRWGRRRPFLLASALPFGLVAWLLFTDLQLGTAASHVYFTVMILLYYTVNSCLEVPYSSLGAELTQDYDERTNLVGFRMAWSQLASIAGAALPLPLALYLANLFKSEQAGWSATAALFGVCSIPMILATWRVTRGRETLPLGGAANTGQAIGQALRNRPFRYAAGVWAFGGVAMATSGFMIVYFMTYVLELSETQSSIAFLILFAVGVLWIPVINWTSDRLGKRWAYMVFVGGWALVQGVVAPLLTPATSWIFFVGLFTSSAGVVTLYITGYAMLADVVEVDEFKSGHRHEGLYYGTAFLLQKVLAAFVVWGIGFTLSWIGYVPDAVQTDTALSGIRVLYAWGSAVAFLISLLLCYKVPVTRNKHAALLEAMRLKKEGKAYSTEAIEDIIA